MSRLSVKLFGPLRVTLDGQPAAFESDKVRALLAFLAAEPTTHHRREKLAGLLWPGWPEQAARNNLRHTLAVLRKAIGDREADQPVLRVTRQTVQFEPSAARVDLIAFASLRQTTGPDALEAWQQAASLYQGDFLQDLSLPDSPEFEEWALLSREQFRRQALDALYDLAQALEKQGRYEAALDPARRQVELDPCREEAHAQAMRLLALSGRRSEALAQYQACCRVLAEELGVQPSAATTRLYEQILSGELLAGAHRAGQFDAAVPAGQVTLAGAAAVPPFLFGPAREVETPVFVAREPELAWLERHLVQALAGQGHIVFVTGEAGSGKTALAQEFSRRAQATHPHLVFVGGQGNAQTGIGDPYLPFREVLELLTGDVEARLAAGAMSREHALRLWNLGPLAAQALVEVGQGLVDTFVPGTPLLQRARAFSSQGAVWLPQLAELAGRLPAPGRDEAGPRQTFLFEQYTSVLQTLARQAPLLVLIDDLQWADLGSISLLFHLGRQLAGSRILLIGAYRPEEIALGQRGPSTGSGQAERHPLEPVVQEIQRLFGGITVDLSEAEKRGFVEGYLETEPNRFDTKFREMLYRQTGGHPLFTVELMRGLEEQAALVRDRDGYWVEGPELDWQTLPARVEAVIASRIDRLPRTLLAALQVASVEGEVFTGELVARVRRADDREILESLSGELERRHRLIRAQGIQRINGQRLSSYRFRHILFQKYLYHSLDEVERAYLHEAVGDTLESLYRSQPEATSSIAGRLAWHFEQAGMGARAIPYYLQAGERALRLSAHQEAIALLTRGLEHLAALPEASGGGRLAAPEARFGHAQQELEFQLALGRAQIVNLPEPQWQQPYARARELCQQMGKTSPLCPILGEMSVYHFVRGEHLKARELAEEALRQAKQDRDPALVALGHWYLALALFCLGEYRDAHAHLGQVISFYDPQLHHQLLVSLRGSDVGLAALAYDACCLWCLGFPDQARAQSQRALALARQQGHPYSLADVLTYAGCMCNSMLQDAQAVRDCAQELIRIADEKSFVGWTATAYSFLGTAEVLQKQYEAGVAHLLDGMARDRALGIRINFPVYYCFLAQAQTALGQPEEALATLAGPRVLDEETEERLWKPDIHRQRAETLLTMGDEAGAEDSYLTAVEVALSQGARSWELRAATGLARLWRQQGKAGDAHELLAGIYGWFTEGFDTPDLQAAKLLLSQLVDQAQAQHDAHQPEATCSFDLLVTK